MRERKGREGKGKDVMGGTERKRGDGKEKDVSPNL